MEINTKSMLAILEELRRVTKESYSMNDEPNLYLEGSIGAYDGLIQMLERISLDDRKDGRDGNN